MEQRRLIEIAKNAREKAYCPYSNIAVGVALLCKNGKIYTGCNIENSAFTPGLCGERVAFCKAVSEGERNFSAIAVVGGKVGFDTTPMFTPCGVCLQFMEEFVDGEFSVIVEDDERRALSIPFAKILPYAFSKKKI